MSEVRPLQTAMEPDVSVRATILAVRRFRIVSAEEAKVIEKCWAVYRKAKWPSVVRQTD